MPVRIRYMDNYLIICEKPVGISSESPGLPDLLLEQTGKKVFPVHRLDRSTGGLIISAFSPDSCSSMQRLFQLDQIEKRVNHQSGLQFRFNRLNLDFDTCVQIVMGV